jgi:hypothetical protein
VRRALRVGDSTVKGWIEEEGESPARPGDPAVDIPRTRRPLTSHGAQVAHPKAVDRIASIPSTLYVDREDLGLGASPSPPLRAETKAWVCLSANALVLPGLGSLYLGERIAGLLQMVLALAGFAVTMAWTLTWIARLPAEGLAVFEDPGPALGYVLAGLLVFGLAWVWSVVSSLRAVRAARLSAEATPSAMR